jgi:Helix-turn-helix domain
MADEDWRRLGDYVVARRIALGMRDRRALAAATGITDRTLGKVETGRRVSASTLGALDNHLGWGPGSCRQVLAGGEPVIAAVGSGIPHYDDPTLQHIAEVPGLPPDVVRGLIALARNWREEQDEPPDEGTGQLRRA